MSSFTTTTLFLFFILPFVILAASRGNGATANFPAVYFFGDSLSDTGNNNYWPTAIRANFYPYGVDYPTNKNKKSTVQLFDKTNGRFSDGAIISDMVAQLIGLKDALPPYLQSNHSEFDMCTGFCFASAGTGFDPATSDFSSVIPMKKQSMYFKEYSQKLVGLVGEDKAKDILNRAMVFITAGTNDVLIGHQTRKDKYTMTEYHDLMLPLLKEFVTELYGIGARKFVVTGLMPVGFSPLVRNAKIIFGGSEEHNENARAYNAKLRDMVLPNLQKNLINSTIVYGDAYNSMMQILDNKTAYGFTETTKGCCGTGTLEFGVACGVTGLAHLCKNRSEYFWFDSIHPTEAAYKPFIEKIYQQAIPHFN